MTPIDLLDYLDNILSCDHLHRLDQASLHRLENLLHHWYVLVGDIHRAKLKATAHRPVDRARRPATPAAAPSFTLTPCPCHDEHALHPGI
jgi:hypothetical protein